MTVDVTVYLPTRNRAFFLQEALRSVLRQLDTANGELIVIDDGSTDETPSILKKSARTHPIRIITNKKQIGAAASRNLALDAARGQFITGLDDDDLWLPGRLAALGKLTRSETGSAYYSSDLFWFGGLRFGLRLARKKVSLKMILSKNYIGNQVLTRTQYLKAIGGFDSRLPSGEDYDVWIRLIERFGPASGLWQPLQLVRTYSPSRVTKHINASKGHWQVYQKHRGKMDTRNRQIHLFQLIRNQPHKGIGAKTTQALLNSHTAPRLLVREALRFLSHDQAHNSSQRQ